MNITIFGTGYVGLVTGACLADVGHNVLCVDVNLDKINRLKNGEIPIYEPGLTSLVQENYKQDRLNFTSNIENAVNFGELLFIAVGTPPKEDGSTDLVHVLSVANSIAEFMNQPKIIINKSTVPVGTALKVNQTISKVLHKKKAKVSFEVCSNPEFLREGSAIKDFKDSARIIIGAESDWVRSRMSDCYKPLNINNDKIIFMDIRSAELTKYAANAILATKISFISELSNLSERLGADMENIRIGIGSDPRIGYDFINPGCGYGGSCFPKDVSSLIKTGESVNYKTKLLEAVESVNNSQKNILFEKLESVLDRNLKNKTIAIWGLSFKPNTDDMREAPSRVLMESLWKVGAKVSAFDPEAMKEAASIFGERDDLKFASSHIEALSGADVLVICTEWDDFKNIDFESLKSQLKFPIIIDGRNLYDPVKVREAGLMYYAIGRGDSIQKY